MYCMLKLIWLILIFYRYFRKVWFDFSMYSMLQDIFDLEYSNLNSPYSNDVFEDSNISCKLTEQTRNVSSVLVQFFRKFKLISWLESSCPYLQKHMEGNGKQKQNNMKRSLDVIEVFNVGWSNGAIDFGLYRKQ